MSENKAKRVSTFAGYKLKEEGIGDEDKEMWSEIKEVADSNKELSTRVAELEQRMIDQANMICKKSNEADIERRTAEMHCADAVKLSKRVEELEKENGNILKDFEELRMKSLANEELQTRLSTLNAEIEGNGGYKDMLKGFQFKIESLESKLSTLLKASEGMEKALEVFSDMVDYLNAKWFRGAEGLKTNRCFTLEDNKDAWQKETIEIESLIKAKQSLADFRAVKETMEKGEKK